jgi:perosamine synthetase
MTAKIREPEIGSIVGQEEIEVIQRALTARSQSLSWGEELLHFEQEFAAYCGAKHAIAVSSGTAALDICAQVLQLKGGDEIISTPQSFWATISAPVARGVVVRFADIDPHTNNIDPATVEKLITPRTKAIYVVHYGGNPAELTPLRDIASRHGLPLVEDCCHAPGASYQGVRIGNGDLCCFSFHSYKNMTTLGEGGMITTHNDEYAKQLRNLRSIGVSVDVKYRHGAPIGPYQKPDFELMDHSHGAWDFDVDEIGSNFRMTAVAAAVGRVQLRKLDHMNAARTRVANQYRALLDQVPGVRCVQVAPGNVSSWHLFTCYLEQDSRVNRNDLLKYLQSEHGIVIALRYWPLHLNSILRAAGHSFGEAPVCEKTWFEQQINLPIGPLFAEDKVASVANAIAEGIQHCRR